MGKLSHGGWPGTCEPPGCVGRSCPHSRAVVQRWGPHPVGPTLPGWCCWGRPQGAGCRGGPRVLPDFSPGDVLGAGSIHCWPRSRLGLVAKVPPTMGSGRGGVCPSLNRALERGQGGAARCVLATAIAPGARGTSCAPARGRGPGLREGGTRRGRIRAAWIWGAGCCLGHGRALWLCQAGGTRGGDSSDPAAAHGWPAGLPPAPCLGLGVPSPSPMPPVKSHPASGTDN